MSDVRVGTWGVRGVWLATILRLSANTLGTWGVNLEYSWNEGCGQSSVSVATRHDRRSTTVIRVDTVGTRWETYLYSVRL